MFIYFASYTYFSSSYFPWAPNMGTCAGEEFAAFAGMGILTSYLLLFISFYLVTYKKATKTGRPRSNTGRQALIDMKDAEVPSPVANGRSKSHAASNGAASSGRQGPVTRSRKA